jgi:hypothetical protein
MPRTPLMMAAVGKSGPGDDLHQLFVDTTSGSSMTREAAVDDLAQVVRRDVGRHADGDAGRAVDQQVREARRQHRRLVLGLVVVRVKSTVSLSRSSSSVRDARHAHLGVAHRRRRVAVHRAEVALPVDQHVAHRERLRHAHDGVVDRRVAVRVVLTDDVADDTRADFL